jgi:hypothetical protein
VLHAVPQVPQADPPVHDVRREVPAHNWLAMGAVSVLACALLLGLWERHVRSLGYEPDYDDTTSLWVKQRQRAVSARPEQLVLVGASRTLFDLDLDVLQHAGTGPRPIQLATVGSNPVVILDDLAKDPSYAGTTLIGIVPPLLAAGGGPPMSAPARYVRKYHEWSPAADWELTLSLLLQPHLAFIQQEDLSLTQLLAQAPVPKRTAAFAPELPPYFSQIDRDRRTRMTERAERDPAQIQRLRHVWPALFAGPPKPSILTDEQWQKILSDGWESNLKRVKEDVAAIRARGGNVIFVRDPSSGLLREIEDRITPRAAFWDRLLRETGAPGIYDSDYATLRDFQCPEWSHLTAKDSVEYTKRLVTILKDQGVF